MKKKRLINKHFGQLWGLIGYSCIFEQTKADAIQHIVKQINWIHEEEKSGNDRKYYIKHLSKMLKSKFPFESLSEMGAKFSGEEWREIIEDVVKELKAIQASDD